MKKVLFAVGVSLVGFAGTAFAHGGMEMSMGTSTEILINMDEMMNGAMVANRADDCSKLTSKDLLDKGEALMGTMLGNDEGKHGRIEDAMNKEGAAFHDSLNVMMGRYVTGCFTDEEQKMIAAKLNTVAAPVSQSIQSNQSSQGVPMAVGLVIGALIGLVVSFLIKKKLA